KRLLKLREGDIARGVSVSPKAARVKFEELAQDMVNDYKVNGKRSLDELETRLRLHILPVFGSRRASSITTACVREFTAARKEAGASNGQINRELTHIKRAFNLGLQAAKILTMPYIPMLKENNIREGFFERAEFEAVRSRLPRHLQLVATF